MPADIGKKLKAINSNLKKDCIRLRVYQLGSKLYLRGTLPPRPGASKSYAHQQWIALDIFATTVGLSEAVKRAKLISAQLDCKEFRWDTWKAEEPEADVSDTELISENSVIQFKEHYFKIHPQNHKTEVTWRDNYQQVFRHLPVIITEQSLQELILSTKPDTCTRRRYCLALCALAKFVGLSEDNLKPLMGNYSARRTTPRNLPTDKLIAKTYQEISDPDWQWVFGMLATYGLRPHEIFYTEFKTFPTLYVVEGKTHFRHIRPLYPEWAEQWNLQNMQIPACAGNNNKALGGNISKAFRRFTLPFRPYDLRHRWAVRSLEFGYDLSLAAAEMGHSVAVHSQLYHHWISQDVHDKAFERLLANPNRIRAPLGIS
jgi:integrase